MIKILIVEDDRELNRSICSYLNRNGFSSHGAHSVREAYSVMDKNMFDLIVSDVMMPEIDGLEFASVVRSTDKEIPIIFMTARDDSITIRDSFNIGVDDYMVKPIDPEELVLRINAIFRRAKINASRSIELGSFKMNIDERSAKLNGKEIQLTAREFNILYKLLSYPKKTFTRAQLMEEFWDIETSSGPRTVDVYMAKLREKLSECDDFSIITVHGLGYKAVLK